MLYQYVDFLALRDTVFKNIPHTALLTTYHGVRQIYDMIDKRVKKNGEAPPGTAAKAKPKATPDKVTTRQSKEVAQIKEEPPILQVTGDYLGGGTDEKEMPYRKEVISDDSSLNIEPSNTEESKAMEGVVEVITDPVEKIQLVDAGELLLRLTAAYTQGKLTQFMVDTNNINGSAVATFWVKIDAITK